MTKFKYILFLLVFCGLVSCEDFRLGNASLEKPTGKIANIDTIFSSKINAEQALVEAYMDLPRINHNKLYNSYGIMESLTDINNDNMGYGTFKKYYYSGQLNSSTPGGSTRCPFTTGWASIRAAYIFINNVDRVPDMTEEEKNIRKAEAYTIIGLYYTELFRHYGGLPWVDKFYNPTDVSDAEHQIQFPRMTVEETVNHIVDLLDNHAIAVEEFPWEAPDEEDGRMTKAAAVALKIRLLHFAASPLFNNAEHFYPGCSDLCTWYGNYDKNRWNLVLDALKQFDALNKANGSPYKLVQNSNPRMAFQNAYFLRDNGEVIISTRGKRATVGKNEVMFKYASQGIVNTTLDYVDMFPMLDGTPFDWDNPAHAAEPFFKDGGKYSKDKNKKMVRDPRLYESVTINGDNWQNRIVESFVGGKEREAHLHDKGKYATGFVMRKFRQDEKSCLGKYYSWPYIRLADLYLIAAETLNELGRTAEAIEQVAPIRARVKMPNITASTPEEVRKAIILERALELGYEESRLHDMVRCKLEDDFKKPLHGLDIYRDKASLKYTYERYLLPNKRAWQGTGWNPKMYLNPFPIDEVNKKYGLTQNPGW